MPKQGETPKMCSLWLAYLYKARISGAVRNKKQRSWKKGKKETFVNSR